MREDGLRISAGTCRLSLTDAEILKLNSRYVNAYRTQDFLAQGSRRKTARFGAIATTVQSEKVKL
jgi:hypothetical protein